MAFAINGLTTIHRDGIVAGPCEMAISGYCTYIHIEELCLGKVFKIFSLHGNGNAASLGDKAVLLAGLSMSIEEPLWL